MSKYPLFSSLFPLPSSPVNLFLFTLSFSSSCLLYLLFSFLFFPPLILSCLLLFSLPLPCFLFASLHLYFNLMNQIYQENVSQNLPFMVITIFCSEGDNIPESIQLTEAANQYLRVLKDDPSNSNGIYPFSPPLPSSHTFCLLPPFSPRPIPSAFSPSLLPVSILTLRVASKWKPPNSWTLIQGGPFDVALFQ